MTRDEDVLAAAALGADALGLVFYPPSPRAVGIATARRLAGLVPPFVTLVGLFVDADPAEVRAVLAEVPLGLLQFHGDEDADYCRSFGRPWIKAVRMRPGVDLDALAGRYLTGPPGGATGLLVDAYDPTLPGGTGQRFDWGLVPPHLAPRVVLAGGLDADNVAAAIAALRPFAVDVSGGVEQAKGIKDLARMSAFLERVRDADESR